VLVNPLAVVSHSALEALPAKATCELNVLGHDRDAAAVDCAKARVSEEVDHVCLGSLLDREDSARLETETFFASHGDLTNEALERCLAQQQFRALLVAADLTKGDGAGAVAEWLLHAAGTTAACGLLRLLRAGLLALARNALARYLAGALPRCLFRASHDDGFFELLLSFDVRG